MTAVGHPVIGSIATTNAWIAGSPRSAFPGFTEKIFMSESKFTGAFRSVIEDVVPGMMTMEEIDPGDDEPQP